MSKKIFFLFILYFLFAGNNCFAATSSLQEEILYYFNMAIALAGILAVIILVSSGIQFIYSAGNPGKIGEAKKRAISAILGLFILLSSFLIIHTINPELESLDPTENLRMIGAFRFVGGRDGPSIGKKSGCGIDECLGLNGTCSRNNCGGYDYKGCPQRQCLGEGESEETDPDGESCSWNNCISSISGCGMDECLGLDGTCSWNNCNFVTLKPAPLSLENTNEILKKYSKIVWIPIDMSLTNMQISNCEPGNPNAVYVLYLYKDYNLKNLFNVTRVRCNDEHYDLKEAKSYLLVKETPGVYFYGNENCYPRGDSPPTSYAQSIPEGWPDEIKSVRIVNGPDIKKGPFFGAIYFNNVDYKTNEVNPWFLHIRPRIWRYPYWEAWDNYSYCFNVKDNLGLSNNIKNGSWVIYKWVGFGENDNYISAGDGVTLHSRTGWLGGYYQINDYDVNGWGGHRWTEWALAYNQLQEKILEKTPVFYSSNLVPQEEQKLCSFFYPDKSCLKSFEIKGNYLVLLSSEADITNPVWLENSHNTLPIMAHAQAFPISPRLQEVYKDREGYSVEKGTPELQLDYIGWLKQAKFIEVIPLTGK